MLKHLAAGIKKVVYRGVSVHDSLYHEFLSKHFSSCELLYRRAQNLQIYFHFLFAKINLKFSLFIAQNCLCFSIHPFYEKIGCFSKKRGQNIGGDERRSEVMKS